MQPTKGKLEVTIEQLENGYLVSKQSDFPCKKSFFEKEENAKEHTKKIVDKW